LGFWKGAIIGGIAGAAYGIWTAPRAGTELRREWQDQVERALFRLTGMETWKPGYANPVTWSATAANPADWESQIPADRSESPASAPSRSAAPGPPL
jgi:hypothetical protein